MVYKHIGKTRSRGLMDKAVVSEAADVSSILAGNATKKHLDLN